MFLLSMKLQIISGKFQNDVINTSNQIQAMVTMEFVIAFSFAKERLHSRLFS